MRMYVDNCSGNGGPQVSGMATPMHQISSTSAWKAYLRSGKVFPIGA